jgi:hypothetical protein
VDPVTNHKESCSCPCNFHRLSVAKCRHDADGSQAQAKFTAGQNATAWHPECKDLSAAGACKTYTSS